VGLAKVWPKGLWGALLSNGESHQQARIYPLGEKDGFHNKFQRRIIQIIHPAQINPTSIKEYKYLNKEGRGKKKSRATCVRGGGTCDPGCQGITKWNK